MIKITVLTITDREICFTNQIEALKTQTEQDFEWVLVDDLCASRHDKYMQAVNNAFPFVHIPPNKIVPYFAAGAAMNDGFVHSHGELIYFMADYVVPDTNCLARHWELHQKYPNSMISGRDIDINTKEDYRLGWFQKGQFRWVDIGDDVFEAFRDGVQNFWTGRNDSVPLSPVLECNGLDEQYDGQHGYHDDDLSQRLMTYGLRYLIDLKSTAWHYPHERCQKLFLRSEADQQVFKDRLIPERVRRGIYLVNFYRNLRGERKWQ